MRGWASSSKHPSSGRPLAVHLLPRGEKGRAPLPLPSLFDQVAMPDDRILVGVLGAPHGVRGELRLKSYTQDPLAIADYSPLEDPTGKRTFVVVAARPVKDDLLVVRLEGVE